MDVEDNEVSLLDLLTLVADNIKLLILVPVAAGLLALGASFLLPKTYTSQAYLSLGESSKASLGESSKSVETVMKSPVVLDAVLKQYPTQLGLTDAGREELSGRIRFSAGASNQKTGAAVTKLEVDDQSPERAQALANALIDAWLDTTKPKPVTKQELERKLKLNQEALADVSRIIARLTGETTKFIMPNLQYDLAQPMSQLLKIRNDYVDAIASIELQLRGVTRDVVVSMPTSPTEPVKSNRRLIAVWAALATGVALLLWVFMRQAWRSAGQDPQTAAKLARLRAALGLR